VEVAPQAAVHSEELAQVVQLAPSCRREHPAQNGVASATAGSSCDCEGANGVLQQFTS
jgi:hypothetical protein